MGGHAVRAALADVSYGSSTDIEAPSSDVRFTPESGHWLGVSGCPLCANNGLVHRSKQHPHSITSSAIASNLSEICRPSDFAV
jgi:hypothetical protein